MVVHPLQKLASTLVVDITNVNAGVNDNDAVNVSQLKKVRADERHIKPGEYAVDANGKVTMTYLDGNNKRRC